MNAITLLKTDHKRIEQMFRELERGVSEGKPQPKLVQTIVKELIKHASAEEKALYPTIAAELPETRRLILKSLEEHHATDLQLAELQSMNEADERLEPLMLVLIDAMRMHVIEEENVLFPALRELPRKRLEEIGAALEAAKRRARGPSTNVIKLPARKGAPAQAGEAAQMLNRASRAGSMRLREAARTLRAPKRGGKTQSSAASRGSSSASSASSSSSSRPSTRGSSRSSARAAKPSSTRGRGASRSR